MMAADTRSHGGSVPPVSLPRRTSSAVTGFPRSPWILARI